MHTIPQYVCGVIPPHISDRIAAQTAGRGADARKTLVHMREIAAERARTLASAPDAAVQEAVSPRKRRRVYDAQQEFRLPGKLVLGESKLGTDDREAWEAFDGCGAMYDFLAQVYGRRSIDDRGMRLDSTIHYGEGFSNALWNGEQMVYGDGEGEIFHPFTASLDVIGHELAHGLTQFSAALEYSGQTGALNEHISDAFGIMLKQRVRRQTANQSDWLIGAELFGPNVKARGVRSMSDPGTAYDDPILGRDPQPAHMSGYVETGDDNGGVHINSGILNRAFFLAATGIGGRTWEVLGRVWFLTLTERLDPQAGFRDFARLTTEVAGQQYGDGGTVQQCIREAWTGVGLDVPRPRRRKDAAKPSLLAKWRQRPTL